MMWAGVFAITSVLSFVGCVAAVAMQGEARP
jgi:hypothetical protein